MDGSMERSVLALRTGTGEDAGAGRVVERVASRTRVDDAPTTDAVDVGRVGEGRAVDTELSPGEGERARAARFDVGRGVNAFEVGAGEERGRRQRTGSEALGASEKKIVR